MLAKTATLNIAAMIVTDEPTVISTILGSCVSVCLFAPNRKSGGMIHFAMPDTPARGTDQPLRYGDFAIKALVEKMVKISGLSAAQLKAKIVGGASATTSEHEAQNVGEANIKMALKILEGYGIEVVGRDVGGAVGRKVLFHVPDGRMQSAKLGANATPTAAAAPIVKSKIKVLVVDDSKTIRDLLCRIIGGDSGMEVIGTAEDPLIAQELLKKLKPDVITLDIHMPNMTGVQWLRTLLPRNPLPVVMITSLDFKDGNEVFQALELGAVDYIQKPTLSEMRNFTPIILEKIKSAATAKVRVKKSTIVRARPVATGPYRHNIVIAIGSSTGGTEALKDVLTAMPNEIPPIVIVQHIPPVFSSAFASRLNGLCEFEVKEAEDGDAVHSNRVLIAPGGTQMKIVTRPSGLFVEVNDDPALNRHKPSVDYLFNSVAKILGKKAIGAVLTGMGADGAKGLLEMRNAGALTLSQNEASCVVYGMPKAAWQLGGSQEEVSLEDIAGRLVALSRGKAAA